MECGKFHDIEAVNVSENIPRCKCGGIIKPDVVLYEEGLDQGILSESVNFIRNADVLIVAGTSLSVYPAASLIDYYRGNKLVLINKTSTPKDSYADLVINESVGEVLWECTVGCTK